MFGDKEFDQLGYHTPESTPDETTCLTLYIPANSAWWSVFTGLLLVLTESSSWQQFDGGMTPDEAAEVATTVVYEALDFAAMQDTCSATVDAPFWDEESGDDTDDMATVEDQSWYGQWDGETFIESLAYVFLTNFLSKLITTQGAIKYLSIPRAFRVLIKQNPHGAKALLFLDGGLYAVINGYSIVDQVLEFVVVGLGLDEGFRAFDVDPVELMIVHSGEHDESATPDENGNYTVDVIRGRLTTEDVIPPNTRYDPETDELQYSPDNGTTWIPTPEDDPRHGAKFAKPLKTTGDVKCDSAASMVQWIRQFIEYETSILTIGAGVAAVGNAMIQLLSPIAPYAELFAIIFGFADTLFTIGSTALETAFTDETYDLMLCCFYCKIGEDGAVTPSNLEDVEAKINTDLNTTAALVTNAILFVQGEVGLQNAGTLYDIEGDCSECGCDWCLVVFFDDNDGGFIADTVNIPVGANYVSGSGWEQNTVGNATGTYIILNLPASAELTHIEFDYIAFTNTTSSVIAFGTGYTYPAISVAPGVGNTLTTVGWDGDQIGDQLALQIGNSVTGGGGTSTISRALIRGTGEKPTLAGWLDC